MRKKHIVFPVLCVMGFLWMTAAPLPAPNAPEDAETITQTKYDRQYGTSKKSLWEKMKFWQKDKTPEKKQKDLLKKVTNRIDSLQRLNGTLETVLQTYHIYTFYT